MASIRYVVREKINPRDKEAAKKFYAIAESTGETDTDQMAEIIAKSSTYMESDVVGVLKAMQQVILESLQSGKIVGLGNLGKFQLTLNTKGAVDEKGFKSHLIERANCRFNPGAPLMLWGAATFVKSTRKKVTSEEEDTEEGGEDLTS